MTTRRTNDGPGNKTARTDEVDGNRRPRGVRPPSRTTSGGVNKTERSGSGGRADSAPTRFSKATVRAGDNNEPPALRDKPASKGKMTGGSTQLASAIVSQPKAHAHASDATPAVDEIVDPVHGWFVITEGPGAGHSVNIGGGRSAIGRGADQHVSLNFGDSSISREKHAWVTFDHRIRKFYLSAGDGRNLCYVNDEPVLTSNELTDRSTVMIGETTMIFIAFCGPEFSWAEDG